MLFALGAFVLLKLISHKKNCTRRSATTLEICMINLNVILTAKPSPSMWLFSYYKFYQALLSRQVAGGPICSSKFKVWEISTFAIFGLYRFVELLRKKILCTRRTENFCARAPVTPHQWNDNPSNDTSSIFTAVTIMVVESILLPHEFPCSVNTNRGWGASVGKPFWSKITSCLSSDAANCTGVADLL